MGWIIGGLLVIAIVIFLSNIFVVQQSRAYVIERLGAFESVQGVGLHFKVPFIDRIARRVSLKEQVLDYPPQPVITKDNVTMQIDTVVYFRSPTPSCTPTAWNSPWPLWKPSPQPLCVTSSATWSWTRP